MLEDNNVISVSVCVCVLCMHHTLCARVVRERRKNKILHTNTTVASHTQSSSVIQPPTVTLVEERHVHCYLSSSSP